jgi:hypothetical protein
MVRTSRHISHRIMPLRLQKWLAVGFYGDLGGNARDVLVQSGFGLPGLWLRFRMVEVKS